MEPETAESLEFMWGTKRGRGGKKKEIQFYESFTFDGDDYSLYDSVYLYKEGEPEPYIGMLIKIWDNSDNNTKKVKVHWFFRPSEILNWIGEGNALENEIFLASGEGVGSANVNPLEAIAGKCNVVCTVKDDRNRQPSAQELEMADYIFWRTFDVEHCTISDVLGEKVAGLEVKFVFNREKNEKNGDAMYDKVEGQNPASVSAVDSDNVATTSSYQRTLSENKTSSLKGDSENDEIKRKKSSLNKIEDEKVCAKGSTEDDEFKWRKLSLSQTEDKGNFAKGGSKNNVIKNKVEYEDKRKFAKRSSALESRSAKSVADDSCEGKNLKSMDMSNIEEKGSKPLRKSSSFADKRMTSGVTKDLPGMDRGGKSAKDTSCVEGRPFKKPRFDSSLVISENKNIVPKAEEKMTKISSGKLSARDSPREGRTNEANEFLITEKPENEKNKWFKPLPWGERMKSAYDQGTLILLSNLDPGYSSSDVEDIMWHVFKEQCTAKMIQRTTSSSPCTGHAFVITEKRGKADAILKQLEDGCLMLPNGRPLVGSRAPPPNFPGKQPAFIGHLSIDKIRNQMQRELREAVSTSHCSQPNNIEFEMALEWCLLQSRSDIWWKQLYKQQGEELRKLKANLKLKEKQI